MINAAPYKKVLDHLPEFFLALGFSFFLVYCITAREKKRSHKRAIGLYHRATQRRFAR